jgi:hypothetical protein
LVKLLLAAALRLVRIPGIAIALNGATMRSSQFGFVALALLALTGCGTFQNLYDPPNGPLFMGTGSCHPFGGVARSGLFAVVGPSWGLGEIISGDMAICQAEFGPGFQQIGHGIWMTSASLVAVADTPLSLAGDILTFPIAYARSKEFPWATWWGEKSTRDPTTPPAAEPDGSNMKNDGATDPSD